MSALHTGGYLEAAEASQVVFPKHIWFLIVSLIAGGGIVWIEAMRYGYLLPAILIAAIFVAWSFTRPVVAISTIILLYLHVLERSEGITPVEIFFGFYFFGYLAYWFTRKTFVEEVTILKTATDVFLAAFVCICFFSIILVVASHGSVFYWLREFLTLAGLLLYFPLRESLASDKNAKIIFISFLVMVSTIVSINLISYRAASLTASYLWELVGSRKPVGAHVFFPTIVATMSALVHADRLKWGIVFMLILLLSGLALAFTFARGFWIATILGIAVLFFLIERPQRRKLFLVSVAIIVVAAILILFFVGGLGNSILRVLAMRFLSSGGGLQDISVRARVLETEKVLSLVQEAPLIGHGIGASFSHYNVLAKVSETTFYIHDGYLFLLFKVGMLGTFLFLGYIFSVLFQGLRLARHPSGSIFQTTIARGAVSVLAAVLVLTVSSNYFIEKQSLLILSLCAAFIMSRAGSRHPVQGIEHEDHRASC